MPKFQHLLHIGPRRRVREVGAARRKKSGEMTELPISERASADRTEYIVQAEKLSERKFVGDEMLFAAIARREQVLFAEDEVHAEAADFDHVAIIEFFWAGDSGAVDFGTFVAGADVVAVVA